MYKKLLGVVGVDSGHLMVIDPVYIRNTLTAVIENDLVDLVFDVANNTDRGGQINYSQGHPGLAVVFESGLGDGTYQVWAYYEDIEGWGNRITKVEVVLIPE